MMREMQLDEKKFKNDKIIYEKLGKAITQKINKIEKSNMKKFKKQSDIR